MLADHCRTASLIEPTASSVNPGHQRRRGVPGRSLVLILSIGALLAVVVADSVAICSQEQVAAQDLKRKVAELVQALDSPKAAARQAAQDELIRLGPAVLPLFPGEDHAELSREQMRRLAEIRAALEQNSARASLTASKVTLTAKNITLSDAVAEIQRQSANQIVDVREDYGQQVTNPEFAADWKDKPFWEVMDDLRAKTGVGYYLHTGERQMGLLMQPTPATPVAYAGPLRIALNRITRRIEFENKQKECTLELEVAWEPRLRPIMFEMKPSDLEVLDDQDRPIAVELDERQQMAPNETGTMRAAVDGTVIRTDFFVHLGQPPKGAEKIKLLRGKMRVIIPADLQAFEFSDLAKAKNVKKPKGNVSVTLEEFKELDQGLWAADLMLEFDAKSAAFESYETWFFDNEAYLQKADGTRFAQNGGITLTGTADGRIDLQYRFVDPPGKMSDYKLIYQSPSSIVEEPVSFELQDLELP